MIISTTPTQKGGRLNIYLDGEYSFTIDGNIWYSCPFSDGDDISEQELTRLKELVGSRLAYNQAVRILTLRAHSEKELRDKLKKNHDEQFVDYAVERCRELGFIDDFDFAQRYANELIEKKHYGRMRVEQELHLKGISAEICENILESIDFNPVMSIINIIGIRYPECLKDEKIKRRAIGYLQRNGYSFSDIKKALDKLNCGVEDYYD